MLHLSPKVLFPGADRELTHDTLQTPQSWVWLLTAVYTLGASRSVGHSPQTVCE